MYKHVIAIILDRYADPDLRQASVARIVGPTPSELCAAFKAQTGMMFVEYVREVRLDRAAATLVQTTRSVKEVWAGVGYNDAANFDHDFKQRFSMTPTQYRARALRPALATAALTPPLTASETKGCPPGRRLVLIADDDVGTQAVLDAWLRLAGYTTALAASGRDALEHAKSDDPAVILLDFHLPDMDGLACLRALRRSRPGVRPAVVLFTADWDVDDYAADVHALGASIVSKLCDAPEVEAVVGSLCGVHCGTVPGRLSRRFAIPTCSC